MNRLLKPFERVNTTSALVLTLTALAFVAVAVVACADNAGPRVQTVVVERVVTAPPEIVVRTVLIEREVTVEPKVVVQTVLVERAVPVAAEIVVQTVVFEREVTVKPDVVVQTVLVEREVTVDPVVVVKEILVEREVTVEPVVVVKEILVEREVTVEPVVVVKEILVEREVTVEPVVVVKEIVVEREVTVEPEIVPSVLVEPTAIDESDITERNNIPVCQEPFGPVPPGIAPFPAAGGPVPAAVLSAGSASASSAILPSSPPWPRPFRPPLTTFEGAGRNEFVPTSEDDTSTFSLDADRTSFQLALNWSRDGYEVVPESVRAEEWLNAFDYGYPVLGDGDWFGIRTDTVRHPLDSNLRLVRIVFQAPEVNDESPLNVTLVLDASGSMAQGDRVAITRAAAETLRSSLGPEDRISIVHFTTDVIDEYTVRNVHPDDLSAVHSIAQLAPHDSTNVQAGLNLGVQLAHQMRETRPDALNYVVLMSDGVANVDATNPFAILDSATDVDPENPLRLITIGVGVENYNDVLLEQLAQHGNGWYRYLSNPSEGRDLFSRENWTPLSIPFADQTRAQVTWNEENVERWRLVGYENRVTSDESFGEPLKKFAEIPSGVATTAFYEIELKTTAKEATHDTSLGNVELRWVSPKNGKENQQLAAIESFLDAEDDFTKFGAIVALASDRYSAVCESLSDTIYTQLVSLADQLHAINPPVSSTGAFRAFQFVLERLIQSATPLAPSGYIR